MHFIQALEQMQAMMRDIGPVFYTYYASLVDAGFTEEQAMLLVVNWQNSVISNSKDA